MDMWEGQLKNVNEIQISMYECFVFFNKQKIMLPLMLDMFCKQKKHFT